MTAGPLPPGRLLPVYQPALATSVGVASVPSVASPTVSTAAATPILSMTMRYGSAGSCQLVRCRGCHRPGHAPQLQVTRPRGGLRRQRAGSRHADQRGSQRQEKNRGGPPWHRPAGAVRGRSCDGTRPVPAGDGQAGEAGSGQDEHDQRPGRRRVTCGGATEPGIDSAGRDLVRCSEVLDRHTPTPVSRSRTTTV